jgi:PAS domain S-box-containing protein
MAAAPPPPRLRLAELLRVHRAQILDEWTRLECAETPARRLSREAMLDHIPALLDRLAALAASGHPAGPLPEPDIHALQRLEEGFELEEVATEFRLLRRSIFRLLKPDLAALDPDDLERIHDELDQAIIQSVAAYTRAANAALRASQLRFSRIFESGIVGLVEWDASGAIGQANDAMLEMLGYTREDLEQGRLNFRQLTPPEHQAVTERAVRTLKETGVVRPFEKQYFRKDGSRIDVLLSSATLDEAQERGIALVIDLSEGKRTERALRQAEAESRAVLAALAEGITLQDAGGTLRLANASAERLLGLTIDEMIGRTSSDLGWRFVREDGSPLPAEEQPPVVALRTGEPQRGRRLGIHRPDGSLRWLSVSAQPIFDGHGGGQDERTAAGVVSSFFDVTEARREEAERRRREEFERLLVGIVSHDLRNPLQAITLGASALARRDDLDPRFLKAILRIQSSAERASRMICDLLDFTRARLGGGLPVHRRPLDLHDLTRQIADEVAVSHPERDVQLEAQGDGAGSWDPDRLAQVVTNLLTNALKYSPEGTPVRVRTSADGAAVRLEVENFGPPIPPSQRAQIFEPLRRASPERDRRGSSIGLGLYIVDQIVRAHGGRIDVASAEDGTRFTVSLPREPLPG